MLFHSAQFLLFLGVTFAVYWAVHRHTVARLAVLLFASLLFYSAWTPFPLLVFAWCATVDHTAIWLFRKLTNPRHRKLVLVVSSIDPAFNLTIYNAASSPKTLAICALMAGIGMPLVLTYTFIVYWVFRGKVKLGEFSY